MFKIYARAAKYSSVTEHLPGCVKGNVHFNTDTGRVEDRKRGRVEEWREENSWIVDIAQFVEYLPNLHGLLDSVSSTSCPEYIR